MDVGVVYSSEKDSKGKINQVAREIDFIATSGRKKNYIQSAYALATPEKVETGNKLFSLTGDFFPKIIVRHDIRKRWYDDNGILNIGIIDFLLLSCHACLIFVKPDGIRWRQMMNAIVKNMNEWSAK